MKSLTTEIFMYDKHNYFISKTNSFLQQCQLWRNEVY